MNSNNETDKEAVDGPGCENRVVGLDLNNCKEGDKLLTKHDMILEYVRKIDGDYPHEVRYPDGAMGTRCDNGAVFHGNIWDVDQDVVEILKG